MTLVTNGRLITRDSEGRGYYEHGAVVYEGTKVTEVGEEAALRAKYPQAEMSLSCPRLRPIINNDKINPLDVGEKQLCQVLCAYRIFLPFVGITVSSRESASFRNGIVKIAATKVSAGVSTGIGDHEQKYTGKETDGEAGDEQFEINDGRSMEKMYADIAAEGLQPVLNDYLYV